MLRIILLYILSFVLILLIICEGYIIFPPPVTTLDTYRKYIPSYEQKLDTLYRWRRENKLLPEEEFYKTRPDYKWFRIYRYYFEDLNTTTHRAQLFLDMYLITILLVVIINIINKNNRLILFAFTTIYVLLFGYFALVAYLISSWGKK